LSMLHYADRSATWLVRSCRQYADHAGFNAARIGIEKRSGCSTPIKRHLADAGASRSSGRDESARVRSPIICDPSPKICLVILSRAENSLRGMPTLRPLEQTIAELQNVCAEALFNLCSQRLGPAMSPRKFSHSRSLFRRREKSLPILSCRSAASPQPKVGGRNLLDAGTSRAEK
jgi:hypothetical protein